VGNKMANYMKIMEQWKSWRFDEPIIEHTVTFTKDEMEKLHKDGKVVKADPDGKDHTYVYNESVNENIKVVPSNKIDSKVWRNMKYDLRDQFDELVKIGPDYGVFQNAQGTAKLLKQIQRLIGKI
tara:strand:+ start:830 stop:1204 length:375 start_codon:yes stop_codon:yes gene_type:complete